MPLPGAKYRVKQTSKGPVRLAFIGGKVVEAKNMKTGATTADDKPGGMHKRLTEMKKKGKFKKHKK